MRHAGQVVTRTMLLEGVWDYHFDPQTNVIDVHVSRLRQKVDKPFPTPLIHTMRNAGYMLRAEYARGCPGAAPWIFPPLRGALGPGEGAPQAPAPTRSREDGGASCPVPPPAGGPFAVDLCRAARAQRGRAGVFLWWSTAGFLGSADRGGDPRRRAGSHRALD